MFNFMIINKNHTQHKIQNVNRKKETCVVLNTQRTFNETLFKLITSLAE